MQPVTHYAKSGDVSIAYQVFGEGLINLVIVPGLMPSGVVLGFGATRSPVG